MVDKNVITPEEYSEEFNAELIDLMEKLGKLQKRVQAIYYAIHPITLDFNHKIFEKKRR